MSGRDVLRRLAGRGAKVNRSPGHVLPSHVSIPADVADTDALRAYLADWSIFGNASEAEGYLGDALQRFQVTMAALGPVATDARILELGSNPYFLTRMLRRRGHQVTCANYFGEHVPIGPGMQEAPRLSDGVVERFDFDHFNIESGAFPYSDGSFDVVLFCEILEHLPFDPVNAVGEIHRVLRKDTGMLLVTTPNAIRAGNVARIMRGENVYESLSGYGAYGRHNREYTLDELERLLVANAYESVSAFTADVHAHEEHFMPEAGFIGTGNRGDNLFFLARAVGRDRWQYPDWLFTSKHGLYGRRIVRPGVEIGINDDLQTLGLHPLEDGEHGRFRWMGTGPVKVLTEKADGGPGRLVVEGITPPLAADAMPALRCSYDGTEQEWTAVEGNAPFRCEFDLTVPAGKQEVELSLSSTWTPSKSGHGGDHRQLGLALTSVSWAGT
jgi:SAM-dependent methyltransferase